MALLRHLIAGRTATTRAFQRAALSTRAVRRDGINSTSAVAALTVAVGGAVGIYYHAQATPRTLQCEGPPGKFEAAASKVKIASKPSSDSEWSSYVPDWSQVSERITDVVVPAWANSLPGFLDKLQNELSGAPGTLASEMWSEAKDASINPEIEWEATVRVSGELCDEELAFLQRRKAFTKRGLAQYLDLDEDSVHEDDVPVIAMVGSGGGLRAMVAGCSSYYSAQQHKLWDTITYTAGVSGSCWLQILYFSTITEQKFDKLLKHLKQRLGVHITYPPDLLKLVTSAPTNKFLLSGAYEKYRGLKDADFGLVDVYGIMLGARLLVPKGELAVDSENLKLSNQRRHVDGGEHPMPIYTAVRHEIPDEEQVKTAPGESVKEKARKEAWFQWFEFTPYELFCEELGAGIPTWAVGREFSNGRNKTTEDGLSLPEIRTPLLMGVFASAFCATLAHYYKEIRPLVRGLTGFGGMDEMIEERNDDLSKVHPITPAQIPNYALHMADRLPKTCPASVHKAHAIPLMDAGMSNNLPIYPLLRPGRNVDIIIAFDASADIKQENWLRVADGYARQRGIKGWPIGLGWPEDDGKDGQKTKDALDAAEHKPSPKTAQKSSPKTDQKSNPKTEQKPSQKTAQSSGNGKRKRAAKEVNESTAKGEAVAKSSPPSSDLGYVNIWVGSTQERKSEEEPPKSKLVETDFELMEPDAGIAVVYFPFMANPAVEGVDPQTSDYMSTWNFVYTPEQVDKVVQLAKANFEAGEEKVKMCIRAVYERKKQQRLEREENESYQKTWWNSV